MNDEKNNVDVIKVDRSKIIVKTSILGVLTNVLLAVFKIIIGLISNSIAVILDAVNNFSDVFSSVVTIIGAKLGIKSPDKKHPLGHGRIEYLSSMIVAFIVLYAGITAAIESIKAIINPETADYTPVSLIIIAIAVVVKLLLGLYVKKQGKKAKSSALTASGSDAFFDALLSTSVLISAIIYLMSDISLEGYVGVIISAFIVRAGIVIMKDTLNDIIGQRTDAKISSKIKELLNKEPEVHGAYDLILHNYGPNKFYGSVHVELPDTMNMKEVDGLTRKLEQIVYKETGVILTGIGVYAYNTSNEQIAEIRKVVEQKVLLHNWALGVHGFYADIENRTIRFDVILSFDVKQNEAIEIIYEEIKKIYPTFDIQIIPDVDIVD